MKSAHQNAKVEILMPYWGDFGLLKKAVDSVLAQTEQDWRLIIADDCYPTDEAKNFYSDFKDKRIVYLRNKENLGLVRNYNYVLGLADADYCVVMGCDDMMLPTYLENGLAKIGKADYYQPGVSIIDEADKLCSPIADRIKKVLRPKRIGIHAGEPLAISLCHGNWLYFPSLMWKTSTLKRHGFNQGKPNTQDLITALDIICEGGTIFIDNTVTFLYRRSATSFSSKAKSGTRFAEESQTYKEYAERFKGIGWNKAARAARLHLTVKVHQLLS